MKYLRVVIMVLVYTQELQSQDSLHYAQPVFVTEGISRVAVGENYSYKIQAMDSAAYPLAYTVSDLPAWLTFDNLTNTISGTTAKPGQYLVKIEVSNQHKTARQNFTLTVCNTKTTSILCLGNSITNGTNKYNSYRRQLWQLLHAGNYNIDMVGSWNKHHMGGEVPNPDFDMDHDGHSGWTFADIFSPPSWDSVRGSVNEWLKIYQPDIVLVELGTNDVFQCRTVGDMLKDLQRLTQIFREKNPRVNIFLAQIPPLGKQWATKKLCGNDTDYDRAIQNLNRAFATFAATNSAKLSPVIIVDQYKDINPDTDMYDDIHPNEKGELIMAGKWFMAIQPYLNKLR